MSNYLSKTKNKNSKRVGRGGKRGKTSGRGTKGQKARAGHRIRPHIRDIIKKLPKLRGRGKNSNKPVSAKPATVNLDRIDKSFEAGSSVTPSTLLEKGLIQRIDGKLPPVKILGTGEITKAVNFYDCIVSKSAQEKIAKAKGSVK